MASDILRIKKQAWLGQLAKELALTGAFENFDKIVQALETLGLTFGLNAGEVLKKERALINRLCTQIRQRVRPAP